MGGLIGGLAVLDKMTGRTIWVATELSDQAGDREKGRFRTAGRGAPSWAHPVFSGGRL